MFHFGAKAPQKVSSYVPHYPLKARNSLAKVNIKKESMCHPQSPCTRENLVAEFFFPSKEVTPRCHLP